MTKPTKWLCSQRRLRSAWASAVWSESSLCAHWVAKDPSFIHADSEDWSDWADTQADLSLRSTHLPFCWFCHEAAHFINPWILSSTMHFDTPDDTCKFQIVRPNQKSMYRKCHNSPITTKRAKVSYLTWTVDGRPKAYFQPSPRQVPLPHQHPVSGVSAGNSTLLSYHPEVHFDASRKLSPIRDRFRIARTVVKPEARAEINTETTRYGHTSWRPIKQGAFIFPKLRGPVDRTHNAR